MSAPPVFDPNLRRWGLVVGIVLVASNLRPALASVGPLEPDLRAATGLSNTAIGTLTTLPLLAFGCVSMFTSAVTRRVGVERAVAVALVLLIAGTALRAVPAVAALFIGTGMLGVGIALGNVLLPAIAKRDFADRVGPITSLYSSMMGVGATAAAGLTVPLSTSLGWRGALGFWAVPAGVALLVWSLRSASRRPLRRAGVGGVSLRVLGRSRLAWQVALYMGFQSLTFYVVIAWLPDLLQSRGLSGAAAGWLLALSQAMGVAGTAVVPLWAGRIGDQRRIIWALATLESVGLFGLLLPGGSLAAVWVALLGFVLGGTFGLALTLLVLRAPDAESAGELSGMAQSVGYLVAATGPAAFGYLHDVSSGWTVPLLFLIGVLVAKVSFGLPAGRRRMVA
ncbi:MAG: MFS transporter [Longimicrobiales bacterium]